MTGNIDTSASHVGQCVLREPTMTAYLTDAKTTATYMSGRFWSFYFYAAVISVKDHVIGDLPRTLVVPRSPDIRLHVSIIVNRLLID